MRRCNIHRETRASTAIRSQCYDVFGVVSAAKITKVKHAAAHLDKDAVVLLPVAAEVFKHAAIAVLEHR